MRKLRCIYCHQKSTKSDREAVMHYQPCSACLKTLKNKHIILKVSESATKKYKTPILYSKSDQADYYPTDDNLTVNDKYAEHLSNFDALQPVICVKPSEFKQLFSKLPIQQKLYYHLKKLKRLFYVILILYLLGATYISNVAVEHGSYESFIGFYNPIDAIQTIQKTPKNETDLKSKAGQVIVLYQWKCEDCYQAYPQLQKDFPDAVYVSAQSEMGRTLRAGKLSNPIQFVPSILIEDFQGFYWVYVPYYNDPEQRDKFIYDGVTVTTAIHKMYEIRKEFNRAVDTLKLSTEQWQLPEN